MAESLDYKPAWDERVLDGGLAAMAVWTLACNAAVILGGTLRQLLWATPLVVLAGLVFLRQCRRGFSETPKRSFGEPAYTVLQNLLAVGVAAATVYLVRTQPTFHAAWWLLVVYFGAAMLLDRRVPETEPPARAAWMPCAVWCLAAGCAAAALVAHRPDIDDCFYLNLSVAAADSPDEPLLAHDTLHGRHDLPLCLPIYRLHSLEVLVGALSHLSGVPVIYISHTLVPTMGAALCCFAWARLFRLLAPRDWLWLVLVVAVIYLFVGGPHRWYSNFALVRMHQGKAILVSLCVPALIAYGLQFAAQPAWRNGCMLSLAQIAALGISSTALWVAPAAVGIALLSGVVITPGKWKVMLAGLATCWYPVLMGLWLRPQMAAAAASLAVFDPPGDAVTHVWNDVFGTGLLRDAALVTLVLAWRASPTAAAARVCRVFPLVVLILLLNPYWAAEVTRNVTGYSAFWRVLWILPCPLFMAIVLAWPVMRRGSGIGYRVSENTDPRSPIPDPGFGGLALTCAAFIIFVAPHPTLSSRNGVELRLAGLKVDGGYAAAKAIVQATEGRPTVLAPEPVAAWIPTFHHHPYPLMGRSIYLMAFQSRAPAEIERRAALSLLMEGQGDWPQGAKMLAESIEQDQLAAISFSASHPHAGALKSLMSGHGYQPVFGDDRYEVWTKSRMANMSSSPAHPGSNVQ